MVHESTGLPVDILAEGFPGVFLHRKDQATIAPVIRSFENGPTVHLDKDFSTRCAIVLDTNSIRPRNSASS